MPISDNDLQVLEEWLDGELPEGQVESVRRRLSVEPELSAAMDRLRDQRQIRSRLFTLLEPSENEIEVLAGDIRREIRREDVWASRVRGLQKIARLAAAIVLVFMAGWISRERLSIGGPVRPKTIVQDPIPLQPDGNSGNTMLARMSAATLGNSSLAQWLNPRHGIDLSSMPVAARVDSNRQVYQVPLQDPSGRVFVLQIGPPIQLRIPGETYDRSQPDLTQPPQEGIPVQSIRPRAQ